MTRSGTGVARGAARLATALGLVGLGSGAAHAQENRFALTAGARASYDSNLLRRSSISTTTSTRGRSDTSVAPTVDVDFSRMFGRQRLFLSGGVGYEFHRDLKFLNRERIDLSGGANLALGARCKIDPTASVLIAQSDLEDLGADVHNTVRRQSYSISASCPRSVGIYPTISGQLERVDNSFVRRNRDQSFVNGRLGLVYSRPSLGQIEGYVARSYTDRRPRTDLTGSPISDDTTVTSAGLAFRRSVSARLSVDLSAGYTRVKPKTTVIRKFSGISWSGTLDWRPSPALSVSQSVAHNVSTGGNLGTSYYVNTSLSTAASVRLSARTSLSAGVNFDRRNFRGEDRDSIFGPRGSDKIFGASAGISYRPARRISLSLNGRYRHRNSENPFYDYSNVGVTIGAGLRL